MSEQPQPTPKITLKLGGRGSPVESPAPQTNGSNGTPANGTRRNPFGGSSSTATPAPNLDQLERAKSASGSVSSPTPSVVAPVKNEEGARNSPAIPAVGYTNHRGASQAVSTPGLPTPSIGMPPPSTPGVTNNGITNNGNNTYTASGYAQSFPHQPQFPPQHSSFESKWRQPGKSKTTRSPIILDSQLTNHSCR
jgi:hypothetical protein